MIYADTKFIVGFYHQCIMMSGTDLSRSAYLDPYWSPKSYALDLAGKVGCHTEDTYRTMECMRNNNSVTWQQILEAQQSISPKVNKKKAVFKIWYAKKT